MDTQQRRNFLTQLLKGTASAAAYPWLNSYADIFSGLEEEENNERYWKKIRKQYAIKSKFINLNNGGVNPQPKLVREAVAYYEDMINQLPSYYMWSALKKEIKLVKSALAEMLGCENTDLALVRNTTEGLQTVISGLPLKKGDEVVLSKHDYPHMKNAWKQRAQKDGVILKWVSLDLPSSDKKYFINQYSQQINDKTKLVCITHITNWNGQVLPIRELAELAKSQGTDVLVDAAHSVGQRILNLSELKIDYLASSLHKWLGAPFGTGVLYVRKEKRKNLLPLFAGPNSKSDKISKFEHQGTLAISHQRAILPALAFHKTIGTERKMKRLLFLKKYIVDRIKDLPGVTIQSPTDEEFGSAILLVNVEGHEIIDMLNNLFSKYNIHCTKSENEMLSGLRISPNIYTQISELDTFIEAIRFTTTNNK